MTKRLLTLLMALLLLAGCVPAQAEEAAGPVVTLLDGAGQAVGFRTFSNYPTFVERAEVRIFRPDAATTQTPIATLPSVITKPAVTSA